MHSYAAYALLVLGVWGHGRLTVPATRKPTGYENDPVPGSDSTAFVCRNNPNNNPRTAITAGQDMDVRWDLSAAHVGDCSVYIGYGDAVVNGVGDAKRAARFIKLANYDDCKQFNRQTKKLALPDWLPAGPAVIRWEWQALHVHPTIEFYAQCADVTVTSSSTLSANDLPSYTVVGPRLMPVDGNSGVGFRNAYSNGPQYYTGPPCAFPDTRPSSAKCALTAPGTLGHIDVSDRIQGGVVNPPAPSPAPATPAPIVSPSPATPAPTVASTDPQGTDPPATPSPTVGGTDAPATPSPTVDSGACTNQPWAACGGSSNPDAPSCCPTGYYCEAQNEWYHQCVTAVGTDPPATPSPTVGGTDAPATPSPTVGGTDAPATPSPTGDSGACTNQAWATCGGSSNPNAPSCCPTGFYCAAQNQWYHQCINYPCPMGWDCYTGRRLQEAEEAKQTPTFDNLKQYQDWCGKQTSFDGCWKCRGRFKGQRGNGVCSAPGRLSCRSIQDENVCKAVAGCNVNENGKCCGKAFE